MKKILSIVALLFSSVAFAATTVPVQLLNPTGSSSGQVVLSNGPVTAPGWGNVAATSLAPQAANTVVANATGSSAAPTAFAMPSCSGTSNALGWTSGTGFNCNGTINAASLQSFNWAIPGALGTTTPNSAAFTTLSSNALYHATNTSAGASIIELTGNGATTPNKYLGVLSGLFTLYSSSGGAQLLSVDDSGNGIFSGSVTPSQTGGIIGTTTNNNANTGSVGEYQQASATGTSLSTGVNANSTSVSLTAGDWDVEVDNKFNIGTGATLTSAGTTVTLTSAGGATLGQTTFNAGISATNAIGVVYVASPVVRFSLSATTTIFATGIAAFSGGTVTVDGLIRARRVR